MIFVHRDSLKSQIVDHLEKKGINFFVVSNEEEVENSKNNIYIAPSKGTFLRPCPGTTNYRCCYYHVFDIMEGCPYNCSYCILQSYLNHEYIKVFSEIEPFYNELHELNKKGRFRVGTGELSDSLALDTIFEFSKFFVPIVNDLENIQFEFKTKSNNISNLLNLNPKNIVVSFSLNSEYIAETEEHWAVSPTKRIAAAKILCEYGYKVAFHFDPVVYYEDWEKGYREIINTLVEEVPAHSVEYLSISTFRCSPDLLDIVRSKFDESILTKYRYITGIDGKKRYFKRDRIMLLNYVYTELKKSWHDTFIYFCMEHEEIWKKITGIDPGERREFEKHFPWQKC